MVLRFPVCHLHRGLALRASHKVIYRRLSSTRDHFHKGSPPARPRNEDISFMDGGVNGYGPVITAAGEADITSLYELLEESKKLAEQDRVAYVLEQCRDEIEIGTLETPLLRAIGHRREKNIKMMLEYGFDPNGAPIDLQQSYARRYRRPAFCADDADLDCRYHWVYMEKVGCSSLQNIPLTDAEIRDRRSTVSPFWTDALPVELGLVPRGDLLHSLVRAGCSSPEIFDVLLEAGVDAQAWTATEISTALPEEDAMSPSQLCVSTPLHSAIAGSDMGMLEALLKRGFNPNARSLIVGSKALTPLQFATLLGDRDAYSHLLKHPLTDANIVTPVFGLHLLHIAVARMDVEFLEYTKLPLPSVQPTALGHTLLHVACLPFDRDDIGAMRKAQTSIHDVRSFGGLWSSIGDDPKEVDMSLKRIAPEVVPKPETQRFLRQGHVKPPHGFEVQYNMCRYIVDRVGVEGIGKPDIHGNTPLHYLAGATIPNFRLLKWLRAQEHGEHIWRTTTNMFGWSPADLLEDEEKFIEVQLTPAEWNARM